MIHEVTEGGTVVALVALAGSLVATLVTVVWKLSSLATRLTTAIEENRDARDRIEVRLSQLDQVPVLAQRVSQLEDTTRRLVSMYPKTATEIAKVRGRLESLHDEEERKR